MADPLLVALVSGFFGAFLAGAGQTFQARYTAFKESKTVAASIRAELTALQELVERREYIASLDAIIARLSVPDYVPTSHDVFNIAITQDYFQVFNVHCPKLGLLGDAAAPVVSVYTIGKATVEDARLLNKVASGDLVAGRAVLLLFTHNLRGLLDVFLTRGRAAIAQLQRFEERRYLGCFR